MNTDAHARACACARTHARACTRVRTRAHAADTLVDAHTRERARLRAELWRHLHAESARDALIVDVRGNAGGAGSEVLLAHLQQRALGVEVPRRGASRRFPLLAVGPVVVLCDENTGSDGEVIAHAVSHLGLGRVVGRRTWGGVACNYLSLELVDGSTVAVPDWRVWMTGAGYALENKGFQPHVDVLNAPQDHMRRVDAQLEAAVSEAEAALQRGASERVGPPRSSPAAGAVERDAAWAFEPFAPIGEPDDDAGGGRHGGRYI